MLRLFACLSLAFVTCAACAQPEPPKYEFRGAWVASVVNLDWPLNNRFPSSTQQSQLTALLDRLHAAGINAVLFQIRSEADAMYASEIEPWSYWLTGEQGKAPEPFYDPLAFAIEEAHKRGMELHTWFNPYRVQREVGNYATDALHVSQRHPEWTFTSGSIQVLDPGLPEVRDHIARVVADVVRRYDVDGVHFDDYFYPYPPNTVSDQDDATFALHSRGFTNRGDWRRDNINLMIAQVADSIEALKPYVKFGISPFGIWRPGTPPGITGMDAYATIYADAPTWMDEGWLDYLTPQLYWRFGGGQDYAALADWWATQMEGRHLYPGHGLYRADAGTFSGALFSASEIPNQIRFNREREQVIKGSVFFRAQNFAKYHTQGFADTLETDLYRYRALTPTMPWKFENLGAPQPPSNLTATWTGDDAATLTWAPPTGGADVRFYAVYRVKSATAPDFARAIEDPRNLLAVTGQTSLTDRPPLGTQHYVVTALSHNSVESAPSGSINVEGRLDTATEPLASQPPRRMEHFPNPVRNGAEVRFWLSEPGTATLRVYDLLGRVVATLSPGERLPSGEHRARWDGQDESGRRVANGTYLLVLSTDSRRESRPLVVLH